MPKGKGSVCALPGSASVSSNQILRLQLFWSQKKAVYIVLKLVPLKSILKLSKVSEFGRLVFY